MQNYQERDRSYQVRDRLPVGSRVYLARNLRHYQLLIPFGSGAVVEHYSNAGFRGIVASIRLDNGQAIHDVPAGALVSHLVPEVKA